MMEKENRDNRHKVEYLGAQASSDLLKWYQKATVFVLPSLREAFPVVNLEALSCETPVVSTSVGGIPEVVINGKNGILVPPNNAIKLSSAIQYLLDDKNARTIFGQDGRKWVAEHFSYTVIVKKLCRIYGEMLA